jgi:hypothetical protein
MRKISAYGLISATLIAAACTTILLPQPIASAAEAKPSAGKEIKLAEEKLQKLVSTINKDEALELATKLFEEYSELSKKEPIF